MIVILKCSPTYKYLFIGKFEISQLIRRLNIFHLICQRIPRDFLSTARELRTNYVSVELKVANSRASRRSIKSIISRGTGNVD